MRTPLWRRLFLEWKILGSIAVKTVVLYFAVLFVFRVIGKRSLGNMAPFDLIVVIMAGEAAAVALEEHKNGLLHGLIPILILGCLEVSLSVLNIRSKKIEALTQGVPTPLVENGQMLFKNMTKEHITTADLNTLLRDRDVDDIHVVQEARLEPTGKLTVTLKPEERALSQRKFQSLLERRMLRLQKNLDRRLARLEVRFEVLAERAEELIGPRENPH